MEETVLDQVFCTGAIVHRITAFLSGLELIYLLSALQCRFLRNRNTYNQLLVGDKSSGTRLSQLVDKLNVCKETHGNLCTCSKQPFSHWLLDKLVRDLMRVVGTMCYRNDSGIWHACVECLARQQESSLLRHYLDYSPQYCPSCIVKPPLMMSASAVITKVPFVSRELLTDVQFFRPINDDDSFDRIDKATTDRLANNIFGIRYQTSGRAYYLREEILRFSQARSPPIVITIPRHLQVDMHVAAEINRFKRALQQHGARLKRNSRKQSRPAKRQKQQLSEPEDPVVKQTLT